MQFSVLSAALLLAGFGGAAPASEQSAPSQAVCEKSACSEQAASNEGDQSPLRQLAAEAAATFVANLLEQVDEKSSSCGTCKELDGAESPVRKALRATLRDLIKSKTVQTVVFSSRQKETTVRHAAAEGHGSDRAARKRSLHLRKAARHLDHLANTLEDEQLGDEADELRQTAQRLRTQAREAKQTKDQDSADADETAETSSASDEEVPAPPKELETGQPQTHHSVNELDIDIAFSPDIVREDHRKTPRRIILTSASVPDAIANTESLTIEQLRGQVRELRHLVHRLQKDIHRMQRSETR